MNFEMFEKIIEYIRNKPAYGIIILISSIIFTLIILYVSSYVKEAGKQRANQKSKKKTKNQNSSSEQDEQDNEIDEHFPAVNLSDGTIVDVIINMNYRIINAKTYTYEAKNPLEILKTCVDSRVRHLLEKTTLAEIRESREIIEIQLKSDLSDEFIKYGVALESIYFGAITAKSPSLQTS